MIPLLVLVPATLALRLAGLAGLDPLNSWTAALRGGLAAMLLLTAAAHFDRRRRDLVAMVPPALPRPGLLVTVTGVLELAGAVGLLLPATYRWTGLGLAALFLVLFPANVHAARAGVGVGGRPPTPLGRRAVVQAVFVTAALAVAA